MGKVVRLSESDLVRLVRKIVNEQAPEHMIANKVENVVDIPVFEQKIASLLETLGLRNQVKLQQMLLDLGIDANTPAEEVHSKILEIMGNNSIGMEMNEEDDENVVEDKSQLKSKIANVLHNIGAGNVAAWGGVPAAMLIGSMTGMPIGFAASWGATALLMGIAKVLGKK